MSNGRNNYLKITDAVIALVILVVVIIGGVLIYKAFTKDDRYVKLLDHRNGHKINLFGRWKSGLH